MPLIRKRDGQAGRVGRVSEGIRGIVQETARFLTDYIVLPRYTPTVIAAWVVAAWLCDVWDEFPHLYVYSPEKRCGKTRLLRALKLIVPAPIFTSSISPAALYRSIGEGSPLPTLLLDEAQSLTRVRSEIGEAIRELLNAGIEKEATVIRCGSKKEDFKPQKFKTYCPKVVAMIGEPEEVLADRSLLIEMRRKTEEDTDTVQHFRSREVQPRAKALRDKLEQWAETNKEEADVYYSIVKPLKIASDRMADLLMPLQAVLMLDDLLEGGDGIGAERGLKTLSEYAASLEERDKRPESQSSGVKLLTACREIFEANKGTPFFRTLDLINSLVSRTEEPWHRWNHGQGMTDEALAKLLRRYDIRPTKAKEKRGYYVNDFQDAFKRYVIPLEKPSNPSRPSSGSKQ